MPRDVDFLAQKKDKPLIKRFLRSKLLYLFLAIICICGAVFYNFYKAVGEAGEVNVVASAQESQKATVAIVLGARVYESGAVSPVLADRLQTGIELYKAGKVKKILVTGDHGQTTYDEVNAMRKYTAEQGIPPEDIFMDHAGFSTYDSMYRARDVFAVKDAIIVTQRFHLPRALYIARQLGIEAGGVTADKRRYVGEEYLEFRESLAKIKALLQLHILKSKPKYLGDTIPITGDGRATYDKV